MKTRFITNMKTFMKTLVCVSVILATILLFTSNLSVQAAFSGHSTGLTREELHTTTITTTLSEDEPAITFITHGLGGRSGDWSNSMYRNANNEWVGSASFYYDSASIIEKIRNQIPSGIKLYIARMNNQANPYSFSTDNFFLYEYFLDNITNPTAYTSVEVTCINDFSQHVVVVFDLQNNYDKTNEQVYQELDYIIDKISYDYLEVMGVLPKINLIGQSRGGLINMDYATNHPKNVASLISIGTPYNGSWYDNWFVELLGIDDFNSIGGGDIVDTDLINTRNDDWNSVYAQNEHINFHAISGTTDLSLMNHIVWSHGHLEAHMGTAAAIGIRAAYVLSPIVIAGGLYVLPGDICVDKSSQEASGYNGVNRYNKKFTSSNSNCNKRSRPQLPVPHNLQTYDSDIHDYIIYNVTFGEPYKTTNIGINEIRIDKVNFTVRGSFNIPATINGQMVTDIGDSALANQNMVIEFIIPTSVTSIKNSAFKGCTNLSSIAIPNSVTSIGSSAFENCTSLTNITLPNNLTTIESSAFKGCIELISLIIPENVDFIGSGAFENCSNLKFITLPSNLTNIGHYSFYGCEKLESIEIPNSVTRIEENSFQNCKNLETVTVLRENSPTMYLGQFAFHGCTSLREIIVPVNRVAEYKNKANWSSYSQKIIPSSEFDEYELHCLCEFNVTTTLASGYNKLYKLNVECVKSYKITTSALSSIKMSLYDSNMNLLTNSPTMSNNNCSGIFTIYLSPGIHYIDLSYEDNLASGSINTSFELTWAHSGWDVLFNQDNDVLTHLHETEPSVYKNKLQYINNRGAGFYKFILTGIKTDGASTYYPEGAITIYNDSNRTTIIDKFTLTGYSNQAKTKEDYNSMVVFLPRSGYFYIDINMTSNNLSSLILNINFSESQEIDLFDLSESNSEELKVFDNVSAYGDEFKSIQLNQTGRFNLNIEYTGTQSSYILFVLVKVELINYTYTITTFQTKFINVLNPSENSLVDLTDGRYYIGFFNGTEVDSIIDITLERIVTQSGSHVLVTDPDSATPSGSQINIIEMYNPIKSYRQSFITQGFTRLIYPDYNYDVSASRLDYYWYSSNPGVATVTDYGTVLGKNVGTVKIMAVLKEDPSKMFVKEFTITEDTGTEDIVVESTLAVRYSETDNGTFKLKLEKVNCPYPWFQDYNWNLYIPCQENDISVIHDVWGYITVSDTGGFILTGNYLKNSRVTVIINVIIEP